MSGQGALPGGALAAYRCARGIVWARDGDGVCLIDREADRSWSLNGLDAAIWDWLALGYSAQRIAALSSLVLRVSQEEAQRVLHETLRRWQGMGIVQGMEAPQRGQPDH